MDPAGATTDPSATAASERNPDQPFVVVIAGGGVAALEGVLALNEHERDVIEVELVCPETEFAMRPLSVTQPFGADPPPTLDLVDFSREQNVNLRQDRLAEVWGGPQRVLLDKGEDVFYDALLLATGALAYEAIPGAEVFRGGKDAARFGELLTALERGSVRRVVFAVPSEIRWSLPLYELALMTAHHLGEAGVSSAELTLVTHESQPLSAFGAPGSRRVTELLSAAGIELMPDCVAEVFEDGELRVSGGESIAAERVVALPGLRVPPITGLPQNAGGFIPTDAEMKVDGLDRVWAVGDASWFPIKQGGLAAQQAEVAAAAIARMAGIQIDQPVFKPVLRGAILTGEEPEFIRAELEGDRTTEVAAKPLWWPPAKVAGARLAPYLARLLTGDPSDPLIPLEDLELPPGEVGARAENEHRQSLELALNAADADARAGDLEQALRWLAVAEKINVTLPSEYAEKRRRWRDESDR